jgi:nicotinate-nucleotide pyrophosphorylase (carboxylating)
MTNDFEQLISLWFAEDIGDGDHTTLSCIPTSAIGRSQLIIKENGVLAGVEVARSIFHAFDPELQMTVFINDGDDVKQAMWLLWWME